MPLVMQLMLALVIFLIHVTIPLVVYLVSCLVDWWPLLVFALAIDVVRDWVMSLLLTWELGISLVDLVISLALDMRLVVQLVVHLLYLLQ
jgi:hypothetical protein